MDILMRLRSEASADILSGYVDELWSYSEDGFARHLSKSWASQSAGELDTRRRDAHGLVVTLCGMHGVGGGVVGRSDLEHVFRRDNTRTAKVKIVKR
jgi:hypothetical protein